MQKMPGHLTIFYQDNERCMKGKVYLVVVLVFLSSCIASVPVKKRVLNKTFTTPFDYRTGTSTLILSDSTFLYTTNAPFIMTSKGTWFINPNKRKQIILETDPAFLKRFLEKPDKKLDSGVIDLTNHIVAVKNKNWIYFEGLNFYSTQYNSLK